MTLVILEAGRLEAGNWKLETGSWKLETGSWKLESRLQPVARGTEGHRPKHLPQKTVGTTIVSSFQLLASSNQQPASDLESPPISSIIWPQTRRGRIVRSSAHDWKSCILQGIEGSNPSLSAMSIKQAALCLGWPAAFSGDRRRRSAGQAVVSLTKDLLSVTILLGRARRGTSGALYPQSATAGLNSRLRVCGQRDCWASER